MKSPRLMIAAVKSGSGKTTITCAFLKQLADRGKNPVSFKCGPDYIDPMFHEQVLGIPSKNLDTFFCGASQIRALYGMEQQGHDIAVLEGVMGLYDGLGGIKEEGSSYHLAETLKTPIILVVDAHGMGKSVIPLISGFLQYDKQKLIKGVILNRTGKMFFETIAPLIEKELGIKALGFLPKEKELALASRHLGLVLPEEVQELNLQIEKAGQLLEQCVDINKMIEIAEQAEELERKEETEESGRKEKAKEPVDAGKRIGNAGLVLSDDVFWKEAAYGKREKLPAEKVRIAAAEDEAFCFYYRDNLSMLAYYGAEIVPFSPLHDEKLPEDISGLLLGGGYPELYAEELSQNDSMKKSMKEAFLKKMPVLAECGGFMYLHESLVDKDGRSFPMVGVIPAKCEYKGRLVRFGYVEVAGKKENTGLLAKEEKIKAHEFHYFDSTDNGADCIAVKPVTGRSWECIHAADNCFLGFPHLYYPSNPKFVKRFLKAAREYRISIAK